MNEERQQAFTHSGDCILNSLRSVSNVSYNGKSTKCITLWDTGATCSAISMDVVSKLNLVPFGQQEIHTPSGTKTVNSYLVDIVLPNSLKISDWHVIDSEIGDQGLDLLVGMDIISKEIFLLAITTGKLHLHLGHLLKRKPIMCNNSLCKTLLPEKAGCHIKAKRESNKKQTLGDM